MTKSYSSNYRGFAAALVAVVALIATALIAFGTNGSQTAAAAADGSAHAAHSEHAVIAAHPKARRTKQVVLYSNMRSLWDQHMQWTYDTIVAFASDSPGLDATLKRLLRNQVDLGNAVKPYYGKKAGNQLTKLLTEHIELAVPVLTAAKAGNEADLNKAIDDWYVNARQIGDFLAKANPKNWKRAATRKMMEGHITQTVAYASDILTNDWNKAIRDYNKAQSHMTKMADQLSAGLISQFPKKF